MKLTKAEAQILTDVLSMVLNDPGWQELATATDAEWEALQNARTKISSEARK
jgi:hypothetical protein